MTHLTSVILLLLTQACGVFDNREGIAKEQLQQNVKSQSESALVVTTFKKTNGYDQNFSGFNLYVIEWETDLTTKREIWKISPDGFGQFYWSNFSVSTTDPKTWKGMWNSPYQHLDKNAVVHLTGQTVLLKTENGWQARDWKVTTSKLVSGWFNN